MLVIYIFIISLYLNPINSFFITKVHNNLSTSALNTARSLAEKGMSKRQMFKAIRAKINEAAKKPGFFQVGDGEPEIQLYCKSNKDGKQIGDCPYTQFLQLVMLKKGIRYSVHPTLSTEKPEWLIQQHNGILPALKHKEKTLCDSLKIAEYLEEVFPNYSLTRPGTYSYNEIIEKTNNFFPTLKLYIINKDPLQETELSNAMEREIDVIDSILRSTPGHYLCGIDMTFADLYIVPQLYHAMVTINHFKHRDILHLEGDPVRPAFEAFLTRLLNSDIFNHKQAYYPSDEIIYNWKILRQQSQQVV